MERYVSFIRTTPKAKDEFRKSGDYFAQVLEIVDEFGGKLEGTWALTSGPVDFVTVATYRDAMTGLKARAHIEALGVVTIESYPVVDMPEYLKALAS
jgi:uncharacterized protein with GYD domain